MTSPIPSGLTTRISRMSDRLATLHRLLSKIRKRGVAHVTVTLGDVKSETVPSNTLDPSRVKALLTLLSTGLRSEAKKLPSQRGPTYVLVQSR
jgi:hypothetical protein